MDPKFRELPETRLNGELFSRRVYETSFRSLIPVLLASGYYRSRYVNIPVGLGTTDEEGLTYLFDKRTMPLVVPVDPARFSDYIKQFICVAAALEKMGLAFADKPSKYTFALWGDLLIANNLAEFQGTASSGRSLAYFVDYLLTGEKKATSRYGPQASGLPRLFDQIASNPEQVRRELRTRNIPEMNGWIDMMVDNYGQSNVYETLARKLGLYVEHPHVVLPKPGPHVTNTIHLWQLDYQRPGLINFLGEQLYTASGKKALDLTLEVVTWSDRLLTGNELRFLYLACLFLLADVRYQNAPPKVLEFFVQIGLSDPSALARHFDAHWLQILRATGMTAGYYRFRSTVTP